MDKLLTIVIPTYNMQDYLRQCLDSLIVPAELMPLLEVLVINDGSKDHSSAIAHEYETKYPDTFRVIDKENGNYGSCVNRGLAEANGKFIKVLDADDSLYTEGMVDLLGRLKDEEADIILTSYCKVDKLGQVTEIISFDLKESNIGFFGEIPSAVYYEMHAIIYCTQLLKQIHYVQTEGVSYSDSEWVIKPMFAISTYTYYDICLYKYLVDRPGQTMDPLVRVRKIGDSMSVYRSILLHSKRFDCASGNSYGKSSIENFLKGNARVIYKLGLIEQSPNEFKYYKMKDFDRFLKEQRYDIYKFLEKNMKTRGVPFHYLRFWHLFHIRFPFYSIKSLVHVFEKQQ